MNAHNARWIVVLAAAVRTERVLALGDLATRARRLWHLMAPQGGPEGA